MHCECKMIIGLCISYCSLQPDTVCSTAWKQFWNKWTENQYTKQTNDYHINSNHTVLALFPSTENTDNNAEVNVWNSDNWKFQEAVQERVFLEYLWLIDIPSQTDRELKGCLLMN